MQEETDAIAGLTPLAAGASETATPETEMSAATPVTPPISHPVAAPATDDHAADAENVSPLTSAVRHAQTWGCCVT